MLAALHMMCNADYGGKAMDILVFAREWADALRKFCCCEKEVLGMPCFEFGNDIQVAARLLAQALGRPCSEESFADFLTESRYIYLDGFVRICDET